ncbi:MULTISPECIES: S49 family peptidase [unclassified Bartonella]|uniref:S49 family peptidase n=1 Tax=unclassified Bartonella TaxID=2645622 RepID=UPI0015FAB724|nr:MULTISPECIES: S49 family peptidase [unclassified Bartonella]UXN04107.1 S49 family peptidase [Bartonella sp. HY406]UXN07094.1 S49 family peptidase [Bartonella sp. HY761]
MANWIKKLIPRKFRSEGVTIPVVRLQGVISSSSSALKSNLSLANCAEQLERAFNMKEAPAVAIVINSPGGSPVQSRLIYKRIRDLASEKNKRVLVFVEDVAASGGYMIACAGDEIFADPSSVVGSIGVVSSSFGFPELMKKIGVERRVYTAGKNKATLDPFSPEKESDINHLKELQLEIHETFINLVKNSRKTKLSDNEDLFTGMFWTGIKGKELGLVDGLNDIQSVLKDRYGSKMQMRLINASKGLLGRKSPSGIYADIAGQAIGNIVDVAEERALWSRYGL